MVEAGPELIRIWRAREKSVEDIPVVENRVKGIYLFFPDQFRSDLLLASSTMRDVKIKTSRFL